MKGLTTGGRSQQGRNYKERNATFQPDYSSLACQAQLSGAFQCPFMLPCHQAFSWLEVLTPSHPPAFHTHHMEPHAALALYHLASGWETKILAFQRLNKFLLCLALVFLWLLVLLGFMSKLFLLYASKAFSLCFPYRQGFQAGRGSETQPLTVNVNDESCSFF